MRWRGWIVASSAVAAGLFSVACTGPGVAPANGVEGDLELTVSYVPPAPPAAQATAVKAYGSVR